MSSTTTQSVTTTLPTTTLPTTTIPSASSPCGIAFDTNNNAYVSYPLLNSVYRNKVPYITTGLNTPMALCYLNGILYVADWGSLQVIGYNNNGVKTTATTIPSNPYGLCSIGNTLYISASTNIYALNVTGTTITQSLVANQCNFLGMCTDNMNIYICEANTKSIIKYKPAGTTASFTLPTLMSGYAGINLTTTTSAHPAS